MKKIILSLILLTCVHLHSQPHTIVLWDLHGVLLRRCGTPAVIWNNGWNVLKHMSWHLLSDFSQLLSQHIAREVSSEELIEVADAYNAPTLKNFVIRLANAQCINPGMDEIVKELNHLEIVQHVGSNIGRQVFDQLLNRKDHPEINAMFDYFDIPRSQVVCWTCDDIIRKPDPRFYLEYLAKNNLDPYKQRIIFVDDKLVNIQAAARLGFIGILFQSPYQLREDLLSLGIHVQHGEPYCLQCLYPSYQTIWYPQIP